MGKCEFVICEEEATIRWSHPSSQAIRVCDGHAEKLDKLMNAPLPPNPVGPKAPPTLAELSRMWCEWSDQWRVIPFRIIQGGKSEESNPDPSLGDE